MFNNNSDTFKTHSKISYRYEIGQLISCQNENKNEKKNEISFQKCAVETENSKLEQKLIPFSTVVGALSLSSLLSDLGKLLDSVTKYLNLRKKVHPIVEIYSSLLSVGHVIAILVQT